MNAGCVVIVSELVQLSHQIRSIPEERVIEVLAPDRPNQSFDKGVRNRGVRNRLDLLDLEDAQVGEPTVEAE